MSAPRRGRLLRPRVIFRELVRAAPATLFVFGDNMARVGTAGQAFAMRGEPNALGVPTKWAPGMARRDFFSDQDWHHPDVMNAVVNAFTRIEEAIRSGQDVAIPADGLGTGLADLPRRAPVIHRWIERRIATLTSIAEPDHG